MSLKVLHFCPFPNFSGLEQYALLMAVEQKKRGNAVGMVVLKGSKLAQDAEKSGLKVHVVDGSYGTVVLKYAQILRSESDLDIMHLHSSQDIDRISIAYLMMKLSRRAWKKPRTIQQNHIWIDHKKRDPVHWSTYKVLDEIWCSSAVAKANLQTLLPVRSDKIRVVNYGRDLRLENEFLSSQEARESLGLDPNGIVIGGIARIDPAKGIWEVLNASIECLREGLNFTLVLIGGPTEGFSESAEFFERVQNLVANLPPNLKDRIRLLGPIPNASRFLKAFDLYIQGSYKETFSLALLDAQLAGLAVLGTNSGGTPEVVRENQTGWLASPRSTESMKHAIKQALSDQFRWAGFGETARRRVQREFGLDQVMDRILKLYSEQLHQ
jgi:glycosyltransferase involved in cell wall biosynthesis